LALAVVDLFAICFTLLSCLAYSTLKIDLFITTAVRATNPTNVSLLFSLDIYSA
jgi:hypothetical protein